MSPNKGLPALSVLTASLLLAACGSDSETTTSASTETRDITLDFRAIDSTVTPSTDITDEVCDTTLTAVGSGGTKASIAYMAFYVSEVSLITSDGDEVAVTLDEDLESQELGVALVDFRNKTADCSGEAKTVLNDVTGTYEHTEGVTYTGVKYQLGLPAEINHADVNSAGILSKAVDMHWVWLSGYRYLRMDLLPEGGITVGESTSTRWNLHAGATGCTNAEENDGTDLRTAPPTTTCTNTNLSDVTLTGFDPDNSQIGVDIAALFAGTDLTVDNGGSVGCMSGTTDPECDEVFARLGLTHDMQGSGFSTSIQQVVFSTLND